MTLSKQAKLAIAAAVVVSLLCIAYGFLIEPNRFVVNEQEIAIDGLDPAFDGLRIVAVSDIHAGAPWIDEERIRFVVDEINKTNADVVVFLGDFVSDKRGENGRRGLRMPLDVMSESLKGITARDGVYAVLGNHDGDYGNEPIAAALEQAGIRVLQNEVVAVERSGKRLRFFGMRDHLHMGNWGTFDMDMRRAEAMFDRTGDLIVLQHSPDVFPVLNAFKTFGEPFKLMLAGHTHGGQVRFPILGAPIVPSSFGQKYNAGHIHEDGKDLFVTTGVGTSALPVRFMVPPEIAVLTLRSR